MLETWHIITYIILSGIITIIAGVIYQITGHELDIGFVLLIFFLWWASPLLLFIRLIFFITEALMELYDSGDFFIKTRYKYNDWHDNLPTVLQLDVDGIVMYPIKKVVNFLALRISLFFLKDNLEELTNMFYITLDTQTDSEAALFQARLEELGINKKFNWTLIRNFICEELEKEYKIKQGNYGTWKITTPVEIAKMRMEKHNDY